MPRPRTSPALVAAALALVMGGSALAVLSKGDGPDRLVAAPPAAAPAATAAAEAESTPTPTSSRAASPAASAAPTASARAVAPAPRGTTARPAAKARRSAASERAADDGSGYGASPGAVVFPYEAGRTSWTTTRDGVRFTVRVSKARPRTGEAVTLSLSASAADACCSLHALYGDGQGDSQQIGGGACPTTDPSGSATFTHAWNKARRWQLQLQASSGGCGEAQHHVVMRVTLEVAAGGAAASNGPRPVKVRVDRSEPPKPGDPSYASYYGNAQDDDGWIRSLTLDYGDGTPPKTFAGDPHPCTEGPGGQPGHSEGNLPWSPPHTHRYAEPGSYVVTLTAVSTGCDGKDRQTGKASFTYTW